MNDEKLIEAVRSYSCLWQVNSYSYKDRRAKDNAWKEVIDKVGEGCTLESCTRRWKYLRDTFVRELKKVKHKKTGDPGAATVSTWPLFDIMAFISDSVKHKNTITNFSPAPGDIPPTVSDVIPDSEEEAEDTESIIPNTCSTPSTPASTSSTPQPELTEHPHRKRRRQQVEVNDLGRAQISRLETIQGQQQQDEEAAFGDHITACLCKFSDRQKAIARVEIEKLLLNIHFPSNPNTIRHATTMTHSSQLHSNNIYPGPTSSVTPNDSDSYYNF